MILANIQRKVDKLQWLLKITANAPKGSVERVIIDYDYREAYRDLMKSVQNGLEGADSDLGRSLKDYNYDQKKNFSENDFDLGVNEFPSMAQIMGVMEPEKFDY